MDIKTEAAALREELAREHARCTTSASDAHDIDRLREQIADLKRELRIAVAEAGPDYVSFGHAERVAEKYGITIPFRMPNVARLLRDAMLALDGSGCKKAASEAIRRAVGVSFSA